MDLLSSYHSDSDDAPKEQEYSKILKSDKCSDNVDYFNLDYSSSDDDLEDSGSYLNDIRTMSDILSDKPYGPQRCKADTSNSYNSIQRNDIVTVHSSDNSRVLTNGTDVTNMCDSDAHRDGKESGKCMESSVDNSSADTINLCYNSLAYPNKKQKTDHKSKPVNSVDINTVNCSSSQTESSEQEISVTSIERKESVSVCEKNKGNRKKLVPRGLPKRQITTFRSHNAAVTALRWGMPMCNHLLLSASLDSCVKIWDIMKMKMVQDIKIPSSRIKSAQWMPCGSALICGGFDKSVHVVDISSGKEMTTFHFPSYVYSIEIHPASQHLFVTGVKDAVLAFDTRNKLCEPIRKYESRCGQVLDVKFLKADGSEFVCSTEIVSGDSSDRTIMAWDFASGAQLSNQIFHERYTCPFLQVDPSYRSFVAQTNGNYIAVFSAERPYKMDKNMRYESHKVSGYPVGLDFSASGKFLGSGDAEGGFYIYWNHSCNLVTREDVKPGVPTTQVKWHPYLHTTVATSSWDGDVQLWE